ncbi:DUF7507 domain-containing protein [Amycolatopsis sp. CA-230715]|uniref:DUF7507 domain-containing protein n=1 Tax=Amycolatopsis sp. CA-230715 TaxID=2745196 RepID=UPI001C01AEF1|nr:DUF11 domain-containing protein [Amycolatopsis sp. CA-230715]QWF80688.1 hypothetical protein HUW46_04112 [Amycolatopsis sp. CA-230715]
MSTAGRLFRILLASLVAFAGVTLVDAPAEAGVVKPFALNFNKTVYGDFLYAGNGVTRCPVAGDGAPLTGNNPLSACAASADRTDTRVNDNYFIQWTDVDSDPGTYNSSRAGVTIPPGAKVEFARLNWAGNTGVYNLSPGWPSNVPMCQRRNFDTPAVLPPGSPANQSVRFTVGGGKAADIAPASYTEDPSTSYTGGQYYSAYADVTSAFVGAPTGSPLPLTVGNVWAPKGFNCMGGWSIAVVYSYPERNADYAPNKREVFVYDGHVRQNNTDPTTNATVTGFRAAAADAHVGVTAYEGDWGISGDRFLINDVPQPEPATGDPNNYFISNTDGATEPDAKNNFSVDAKSFKTAAIPAGATSAKLGFGTTGDSYLAQNLAFSTPVPELQITKTASPSVVHEGEPVTFTITVTNPSGAPASGVRVEDPAYPACARTIGSLAGGASTTYTCGATAPADDFTNTAKVTGRSALDEPLDGSATTAVDVIHPAVGITKKADKRAYRAGDTVTFTVRVTNTGDVPLTNVTVTDPKTASCARTLPQLAAGASTEFTCTTTAPVAGGVNTATVTGTDQLGKQVTASADAPVPVIAPAIDVTKSADPATIHAGDKVTWTITVKNTGDSPLDPVKLTDDTTTACGRTLGALAPGATQTYSCTANPSKTTTNTVTADGTDASGQHVTDTASATVTAINPGLTIEKSADPKVVHAGDTVTFTITVTNSGDVPLTGVSVVDDRTPSCARTIGTLAPQGKQTFTCTGTAPADDFTNTATASGKDPIGRETTVTADAVVDVIHPAVAITKDATPTAVREGDTVTYAITVTNTGDVPLSNVRVADDRTLACARTFDSLAPQGKQTYQCTTIAGDEGFTNTATVTGTDPIGRDSTASDDATFTVQKPAVTIAKDVRGGPFREGDTVTYAITVTNSGDVPLTGVAVTDPLAPGCARTYSGTLAVNGTWTYECTGTAPADDFTNVATTNGTPPVGPPVTATDDAKVSVIHPAIAITKDAAPAVVRAGDTVTFTITVTNTGDSPLSDVTVTDPVAASCAKHLGTLAPQGKQTYECTMVAGEDDFTNTASVTGSDGSGRPVTATDDAKVDVIHPAIAIQKDAAPGEVREGDTVTFTLTVTNAGDVPLTNVSVVDDRTPACARTFESLAPQAKQTYQCTTVAGAAGFTNTATATGTDPTDRPVSDSDDASFVVHNPGLSITKDALGGPFRTGDRVTFRITVTNTGDVPLRAVSVVDPIAADCARTFAEIAAGASESYECTMTAPPDDVVNVATATGTPPVGPPVTGTDDAKVDVIHPAVTITKDASPAMARVGETVTFTLVVRNTGDVPLTNVSVVDDRTPSCARTFDRVEPSGVQTYTCTAPAGQDDFTNTATVTGTDPTDRTVTATDDASVDVIHPAVTITKDADPAAVREGDTVTFTITVTNTGDVPLAEVSVVDDRTPGCAKEIGTLAPQGTSTHTCTVVAGAQGFTNTATVTGDDPTKQPVTATDDATFTVQHPGIAITKDVRGGPFREGDSVPFTITVTNTGDVPLTGVTVADPIAAECARTVGDLPVGGKQTFPCTMTAPGDDVTNVATATGTPPTGPPVTSQDDAEVDVIHPGVEIQKDASPPQVRPGEQVTFTITVTNTGDVPLTNVSVVDDRTPACGFTAATLAPNATEKHTCTITASEDVTNTATVTGDDPTGRKVTDTDDASVDVIGPGITVTKTGPAKPVLPGQKVTFTVVAKNTGDVPLVNVKLDDPVAKGCSVEIGSLAVGAESKPVTCELIMGEQDITNTVTATGDDPTGKPVDATDDAVAKVAKPGLDVTKKASAATARAGETVTFTLTVTNTGNVDLAPVKVSDPTLPVCDRVFEKLAAGAKQEWTCTTTAPQTGELVNVATGTGTPDTEQPGDPVRDTGTAKVTVHTPDEPGVPETPGEPGTPGTGTPKTPKTPLAKTGVDVLIPGLAGFGMVLIGAALVFAGRRTRRD